MPREPRSDTLEYLDRHGLPLYATCGRCHSTTSMSLRVLGLKVGWKTTLEELAPRLRCMTCKTKNASLSIAKPVRRCPTCQRPLDPAPFRLKAGSDR